MCWYLRFLLNSRVIVQIGSIFEYVNERPVFGVLSSDSVFYAPVLGFFAFTGFPSAVSVVSDLVILINMDRWYWGI